MKMSFEKKEAAFMKEKKEYRNPEVNVYAFTSEPDVLTTSDLPILQSNETPLIFY